MTGPPRQAAAFGTLVHALLALPEFPEGDALARTAAALATQRGLDAQDAADAAELAQRVRALPALAAIGAADVVYREVPFVYRTGGQVLDGRIDLAYRVGGSWTVIDFKTARLGSAAEARARYGDQLRRYRTALGGPDRPAREGLPLPRPHRRAGARRVAGEARAQPISAGAARRNRPPAATSFVPGVPGAPRCDACHALRLRDRAERFDPSRSDVDVLVEFEQRFRTEQRRAYFGVAGRTTRPCYSVRWSLVEAGPIGTRLQANPIDGAARSLLFEAA